jgi:hypothetical protein
MEILFDTWNHQINNTVTDAYVAPTAQGHTVFQSYSIGRRYEFVAQVSFTFSFTPVMARQSLNNSVIVVTRTQTV